MTIGVFLALLVQTSLPHEVLLTVTHFKPVVADMSPFLPEMHPTVESNITSVESDIETIMVDSEYATSPMQERDETAVPQRSPMLRLFDALFANYRKQIRPRINNKETIDVHIQFWFKQILKVNEADQMVTVHCWLEMYWRDDFMKWNPSLYGGINTINIPAKMLWLPDLLVYNNANMNVDENEYETNAIVQHNGDVMLFRSVITDITCKLDMTYFPFDEQACSLMLASWSNDGSKIFVHQKNQANDSLNFFVQNSEWNIEGFALRQNVKIYDCCPHPYPDLTFYFIISRNPGYYMNSLIIPSAFIELVTIIGYFTPHSSTGENTEKVSLGVTSLLSMAIIMMMVADEMPATTDVLPLIGKYYIGLIFILFLAAFSTTITLATQMRGLSGPAPSYWTKYVFFNVLARFWLISILLPELPEPVTKRDRQKYEWRKSKMNNNSNNNSNIRPRQWLNRSPNATSDFEIDRNHNDAKCNQPSHNLSTLETMQDNANLLSETGGAFGLSLEMSETAQLHHVDSSHSQSPDTDEHNAPACTCHKSRSKSGVETAPRHRWHSMGAQLNGAPFGLEQGVQQQQQQSADNNTTINNNNNTQLGQQLHAVLYRVALNVQQIRQVVHQRESREEIAREWRQVARVLERLMMFVFIGLISAFAGYVLSEKGTTLVMNKELMDKLSNV